MSISQASRQANFLEYSHTIGLSTMAGRGFYYPNDAHIGPDGRIYVVNRSLEGDTRGVRVVICNLESEYFGSIGSFGAGDGEFIWPTAVNMDSQGRVYVSDEQTHRITAYDPSGGFAVKWGVRGSGPGEIDGPSGMAFDSEDNLYVVDQHNNRVQKFTRDGRFLLGFGSEGPGDGQFNLPWGIALDARGDVYVADWRNDRIQKFSPDGKFLAKYGSSGRGDGEFHRPASAAVDAEGYMYIADWGNERVQVLDPEGGFVLKLRGEATDSKWAEEFLSINLEEAGARANSDLEPAPGLIEEDPYEESSHVEKYFWAPVSVKLDDEGRLYVTESNRHRIQIYKRRS